MVKMKATPNYREARNWRGRKQLARKELNWIRGHRCRSPVKSLCAVVCYISCPVNQNVSVKEFFFIGILSGK